jgi:iron complex outermembrane receptor protein
MIYSMVFLCMCSCVCFAEDSATQLPVVELDEVKVVEKKIENGTKTAGIVKVVDQADLEKKQLTTSSDVLKYLPSVSVVSRQPGADARLKIRGLGRGGRSIAVSDGVTMTDFTSTYSNVNWSDLAPEEIDKVEVTYGPFSALYSGNAMGGAVSITTKEPEKRQMSISAGYGFQTYSVYRYSETLPYSKVNLSYGDKIGRLHLLAVLNRFEVAYQPYSFSTKTVGGTRGGDGVAVTGWLTDKDPNTGEARLIFGDQGEREELKYMGKVRFAFDITEDATLSAEYRYTTDEQDRLNASTYLEDADGNPVWEGPVAVDGDVYSFSGYGSQERESASSMYRISLSMAPDEGVKTRAVFACVDNFKNKSLSSSGARPDAESGGEGEFDDASSGWYNADWRTLVPVGDTHAVTAGFHFDQYFSEGETWELADWRDENSKTGFSDASEGKTKTSALFLQDEWGLSDKYSLYLGGRYEWWEGFDGAVAGVDGSGAVVERELESRKEDCFSPKAALTYHHNEHWRLRLSLAEAYRFPTVLEIFYGSIDSSTGYATRTNPDLKTEKTFAKEISVSRFLDNGEIRLSLFENEIEDYILRQTNIETEENYYQNVEEVRIRGVELDFFKQMNSYFKPGVNVTFLDPKIIKNSGYPDSEGKIVPRIAEWSGNIYLEIKPLEKLAGLVAARFQSDPYRNLDNSDLRGDGYGGDNGYFILDTKFSYRFENGFRCSFAVDNITNEKVYSYHPFNQRMFSFELKHTY